MSERVGQAGFDCTLEIGENEVLEAKDVKINMSRGEIEDTDRGTSGWRSFIAGLGEWTIEFNLLKKSGESTGMTDIRTAFLAGTNLSSVTMTDKNGYGWTGSVAVLDFSEDQPYEDAVAVSVKFRGRGAPTQVTPSS